MKTRSLFLATITLIAVSSGCGKKNTDNTIDATPKDTVDIALEATMPIANKLRVVTSMGDFTLELLPEIAPKTVENFKKHVRDGFYEGIIFHRVIPNFMIQAGLHNPDMSKKPFKGHVVNEAEQAKEKGLLNTKGTISMAYAPGNPLTGANVQFFINLKHNTNLDFKEKTITGYGHCPFGKVVKGMDVVEKISRVGTKTINQFANVPVQPVTIAKIEFVID